MIKYKNTFFFVSAFTLITILCIGCLVTIIIFNYQDTGADRGNTAPANPKSESQSHHNNKGKQATKDYWTKKRMKEAKPAPMPTAKPTAKINSKDVLKSGVMIVFPYLIIGFIIFVFMLILMNLKKVKLLEEQNKEILNELSRLKNKSDK